MNRYILDENGVPVREPDLSSWARWMVSADRHVAEDEVKGVRVSTVFLGLDHRFGPGVPLLFETMIFGGRHDQWQERWATREEAAAGHRRALHLVNETDAMSAAT